MSATPMSQARRVIASCARRIRRKSPWIQQVPMAGALAGALLLGASMLPGCLLPQDDYVLPAEPQFLNRAPRFIEKMFQPASPLVQTSNNCTLSFTVVAADDDLSDILRVRFYVDYDPVQDQGYVARDIELAPKGTAERDPATWTTNLAAIPPPPLANVGSHVVEAVLFDGSLGPNRTPIPKDETDAGRNESYVVIHQWVVQTSPPGECL